ncbi:MAG TPA: aldo/keto reductase [Planctomycetota bacterium]|jgi:predicted aldo/keto reductase-like oxidoreductase|nr:aldo/keto reductase [Planctomycetota bacterium]HQB01232.1 aldo/keto reductase [Planctomycetota bacterium]
MNRREFLKNSLAVAALGSLSSVVADTIPSKDAVPSKETESKPMSVVRRKHPKTGISAPLLGYGLMRMPRIEADSPKIDYKAGEKLIQRAMEVGINYFDTAYMYHDGLCEVFVGDILSKYPRDSFLLANKMPVWMLQTKEDLERIFNEQLTKCKTEYFDVYLLHSLDRHSWSTVEKLQVFEYCKEKQKQGKIKMLGFSFHDEPEVLKVIAEAYPWDVAQIQLNYLDWDLYRSREQYEILTKLNIPVIVMEPLRGGALATLKPDATAILRKFQPNTSTASWAFRFAGSLPNVWVVLSGMTYYEHLEDNIKTMSQFQELTQEEKKALNQALLASRISGIIPCTTCRYCVPCPIGVDIPRIFALYNDYKSTGSLLYFSHIYNNMTENHKASACIECNACVSRCPQHINIPTQLKKIVQELELHENEKEES